MNIDQHFSQLLKEAGEEAGFEVSVELGGYFVTLVDRLTSNTFNFSFGHTDLNSATAVDRAKDKVLCTDILNKAGISNIQHTICTTRGIAKRLSDTLNFKPLVIKPIRGGGGKEIHLVKNPEELLLALSKFDNYATIALSPYEEYLIEYRVSVVNGKALMCYQKRKNEDSFQHNLSQGSKAEVVDENIANLVNQVAIKCAETLGLGMCNVDMFLDSEGNPKVVEVNSSIYLKRVIQYSPELYNAAKYVYKELFRETNKKLLLIKNLDVISVI